MTPDKLAGWTYAFSYNYLNSAQDSVNATVQFNLADGSLGAGEDGDILFAPLAQFVTVNPAIASDFESYLRKINSDSKKTDTDVVNARYALAAFEAIVAGVAAAYRAWAMPPKPMAAGADVPKLIYYFDIVLNDDDGVARVDVVDIKVENVGGGGTPKLPLPLIRIEPGTYESEPKQAPAEPPVSYKYTPVAPGGGDPPYLSYQDALAIPGRTVVIDMLNVFSLQNAWAAVEVTRNQFLVPGVATTDTFKFSMPQVKFAAPLVPLLDYAGYDLGALAPGPAELETYLANFFASLFTGASGLSLTLKRRSSQIS